MIQESVRRVFVACRRRRQEGCCINRRTLLVKLEFDPRPFRELFYEPFRVLGNGLFQLAERSEFIPLFAKVGLEFCRLCLECFVLGFQRDVLVVLGFVIDGTFACTLSSTGARPCDGAIGTRTCGIRVCDGRGS